MITPADVHAEEASHTSSDRLNIAVWHHLPSGGAKRALYHHVRGLVEQGHHLEIWSPPVVDRTFLDLGTLAPQHELPLGSAMVATPLRWLCAVTGADARVFGRMNALEGHAEEFGRTIAARHFDILFAAPCEWFSVPPVARNSRIPSVLYLQEPHRRLYEAQPTLPWIAETPSPRARWWSPSTLRHFAGSAARVEPFRQQASAELCNIRAFDSVLVNSKFSRESAYRAYGLDTHVCYLGVDTALFANNTGERHPFTVSVGRFEPGKNPEFLIRAIARSRTKPRLVWIANGVDSNHVRAMEQLGAQLGVTWQLKTAVSDAELVHEYQRGLVMLYAPRLEPFGLAPLEANSCGMPVIALDEGGMRETIVPEENGMLVDSEAEMAAYLDRLVQDPPRARELGQRAARYVRRCWTLNAATSRLENHLRRVATARRAQGVGPSHPVKAS